MRKCTFKQRMRWTKWVNHMVIKRSNKSFKSGLKSGIVIELTTNPYSNKPGFLMGDGTIVDCYQCKLLLLLNS